jgi:hypothetical protein
MAFSRSVFEKPPGPRRRGRPKKKATPVSIWLLAMDFIKPGVVKRKDRYQAGLNHMNVSQASLAKSLEVEERSLISYADEKTTRAGALTLRRRQQLAKLICGDAACEPWLTNGTWILPTTTVVAPRWLTDAGVEDKTKLFVRWMTLGHYRSRASGPGARILTGPLSLDFLVFSGESGTSAYGNDKAWAPSWWEKNVAELDVAGAETKAAFAAFLKAMRLCKIWHREFINLMPFEVGRAYEAFLSEQKLATGASGLLTSPTRGQRFQRPVPRKSRR